MDLIWILVCIVLIVSGCLVAVILLRCKEDHGKDDEFRDRVRVLEKSGNFENNKISLIYSKIGEPMIPILIAGKKTYVVFDTGSSAFWIVGNCVGSCAYNSSDLPGINLTVDESKLKPTSLANIPSCQENVCSYGSCGCSAGPECPSTCEAGSGCSISVKPYAATIGIGGAEICAAVAIGSESGSGNASSCGGVLGIMGAGDFTTSSSDTENFFYNYFMHTKVLNFSFRFGLTESSKIDMSATLSDTNTDGLSWMKRYRYNGMPYVIVRLIKVRNNEKTVIADYTNSSKMVILDTGTSMGGSFCSDVRNDIGSSISQGQDVEFVFEGVDAEVSWPMKGSQYVINQAALPRLVGGNDNLYLCESCQPDFRSGWSLLGNLFFSLKRVLVDFENPRVGVQVLSAPKSHASTGFLMYQPGEMRPAKQPTWKRTPKIPQTLGAQRHLPDMRLDKRVSFQC